MNLIDQNIIGTSQYHKVLFKVNLKSSSSKNLGQKCLQRVFMN